MTPRSPSQLSTSSSPADGDKEAFATSKAHLLGSIRRAPVGEQPFFHAYLENIFPDRLYDSIRAYMLARKYGGEIQDRLQDNPSFINKRFNLQNDQDEPVASIRALFSDREIMRALLAKFYVDPSDVLIDALHIHKEFEFFFTTAGRFQNIHIDIPPKFLSFVFYIPERETDPADALRNGTILYDKNLQPHYKARFAANSACVFAPHFSTYHGFASTIDRDVLVMFYINRDALETWRAIRRDVGDVAPFTGLLDAVEDKVTAHPLIEFAGDGGRLAAERSACRVNAPDGRVLRDAPR